MQFSVHCQVVHGDLCIWLLELSSKEMLLLAVYHELVSQHNSLMRFEQGLQLLLRVGGKRSFGDFGQELPALVQLEADVEIAQELAIDEELRVVLEATVVPHPLQYLPILPNVIVSILHSISPQQTHNFPSRIVLPVALRSSKHEEYYRRFLDDVLDLHEPHPPFLLEVHSIVLRFLGKGIEDNCHVFGLESAEDGSEGIGEDDSGNVLYREEFESIRATLSRYCQVDYVIELPKERKQCKHIASNLDRSLTPLCIEQYHNQFSELLIESLLHILEGKQFLQ